MDKKQETWDIAIAKQIKSRDNPAPIGAVLGKILKPLPDISIELLGGYGVIDKDKIYLSNAITNRLAIECTFQGFESKDNKAESIELSSNSFSNMTSSGIVPAVITKHNGNISSINTSKEQNSKENKAKGKFKLQTVFNLKAGMFVLVIPNVQEDKFFVVDVFNYAEEVSLEWEYYQK